MPRPDQAARRGGARLLGGALVAIFLLLAGPAAADMFTVSGVAIEASGQSAVEAKQLAISEGQAKAFTALISRLARPEEAARIPPPDTETLQSVIAGYSLDNERTTATDYLADLTVRFNSDAVEFLLSRNNIRLSVETAPPALIVPVHWTGSAAEIFEESNLWRAVWQGMDLDNRLFPGVLPIGDAADSLIDANAVARGDPAILQQLAGRYGVQYAFAAVVAYDLGAGLMEAALTGQGPRGPLDLRQSAPIAAGEEEAAMRAIALKLLDGLDEVWRAAAAADPAQAGRQSLELAVPFASLQEWVGLRRRIEVTPGVESVEVRTLNAGAAQITVSFAGGFREFAMALQAQGLNLYDDGSTWVVRMN